MSRGSRLGAGLTAALCATGCSQPATSPPGCRGAACVESSSTTGPQATTAAGTVSGGTATAGTTADGATAGSATAGDGGTGAADPSAVTVTATVHRVGRFADDPAGGARFAWPGSTIMARFTGTGIAVTLEELGSAAAPGNNHYDVTIDGGAPTVLAASPGLKRYVLATGLTDGSHSLVLRRRTETSVGVTRLVTLAPQGGALTPWTRTVTRRLLFIGDSITCGYGIEGEGSSCGFSPATENVGKTAALRAAASLGADAHVVAWSGRGVYRNNDSSTTGVLPDLIGRTIGSDANSTWRPADFVPQAVVVNLGTNDFFPGVPPAAAFRGAMAGLLRTLRAQYPLARVLVVLGPMLSDTYPQGQMALSTARTGLRGALSDVGDARMSLVELTPLADGQYGCDYHPGDAVSVTLGQALAQALSAALGW